MAGATGYTLYQTTDNLSGFENADPANLAAANPAAGSSTFAGTVTSTVETLSGADTHYFLITSTQGGVESLTSAAQIAATAHPLTFNIVAGGGTGTFWMDRNLGASQKATASDDTDAYGDLYQFGRPADGHQLRGSTPTGTLALNISPGHADFITTPTTNDWTAAGVDDDGAQRQALWSSIDGSGVCPTGFRVPTADELDAERLSWSSNDAAGALASNLKLPIPALHFSRNGGILNVDIQGYYWAINFSFLSITASNALIESDSIANGLSVRCIMN